MTVAQECYYGGMPDARMTSPSAARNTQPILAVLKAHLPAQGRVLEIACGSGEHAVAFSRALPGLAWTPSDCDPAPLASAHAWREAEGPANLNEPILVDVRDEATWPDEVFQAVVAINLVHISPWSATEGLLRLAGRVLTDPGGLLVLYGPYREAKVDLAPSNAAFDEGLKARNPDWGLRDRADVAAAARDYGLVETMRIAMPANNITLLYRRL